ncbi:hypothetical protein LINGRAHAP2_LOCUS23721 [Linum grandiflorum]
MHQLTTTTSAPVDGDDPRSTTGDGPRIRIFHRPLPQQLQLLKMSGREKKMEAMTHRSNGRISKRKV